MKKLFVLIALVLSLFAANVAAAGTGITMSVEDGGSVGSGYRCVYHASTGEYLIQFYVAGYWLWTTRLC